MIILFDNNYHDIAEIETDIDVEVGTSEDSSNDFVLSNQSFNYLSAKGFYIPSTEIGGVFEYSKAKSESDSTELKGFSWRGLLTQAIIEPPTGSDYMTVSGEANSVISTILSNVLGGFFKVSTEDSGLTVDSYHFPLYINVLDGIEGMLETYGYRLYIHAEKEQSGVPFKVIVEAVEATTVEGVFNEDNGIPMLYENNNMGVNHLVCGGAGDLQERLKIDLYIDNEGNVGQTPYYTGFEERTAFYDYGNAESEQDLIDSGTEELKKLASSKSMSLSAPDLDLEIGDKVKGIFPDGSVIESPIVRKIYTISNGILNIEVKVKGEI